jgi:hypothetical protein
VSRGRASLRARGVGQGGITRKTSPKEPNSRAHEATHAAKTSGGDSHVAQSVLQWFAIIAPLTTVATALAFWFGWTMTGTRASYFGIDQSLLEYSTVDYLLRSADAMIVPAILVLLIVSPCIGIHALVAGLIRRGMGLRAIGVSAWVLLPIGTLLTLLAIWSMFRELPFRTPLLFEPFSLGIGVGLSGYTFSILRWLSAPTVGSRMRIPTWEKLGYLSVVLLVVLALFWACSIYAGALGTGRAKEYLLDLGKRPSVTLYSVQSLAITKPVQETKIVAKDSKYHFKYTGLKFVTQSAGKYFLLPADWSHEGRVAIVLPASSDYRMEFNPGGG